MTTLRAYRVIGLALALAVTWAAGGCTAMPDERRATFGIDFRLPEDAPKTGAIVFMIDGLNRDVFAELLAAGRLPNFQKYFIDRGLYIERAVVSVPGITIVNETSLVTGLFPGHHGITGNTWFDRNHLLWRNYECHDSKNAVDSDYAAATIFERLGNATTFSLFHQVHRGATKFTENWTSAGPPYFFGWYGLVDRITLWRFDLVAEVARKRGAWPVLTFVYQLTPDMEAYRSGVSSGDYRWGIEHADAHIGRILRDLESAGLLDQLVLALVSDHGTMDITRRWSVRDHLRKTLGLNAAMEWEVEAPKFETRLDRYAKFSCVTSRGDRYWALYLRKPKSDAGRAAKPDFEDWLPRPTVAELKDYPTSDGRRLNLIDELLKAEAVDTVACADGPGRVLLTTKTGAVELAAEAGRKAYRARVIAGEDPLGYRGTPAEALLDGQPHDDLAWLRLTADTPYPDLAPQMLAYFEGPRAADLAVFATPGWNFGFENKAGHGGLHPTEMFVPMILAGPGVPHERRTEPARTVDLMPTLLHLLGRPVPTDIDGRNLLAK